MTIDPNRIDGFLLRLGLSTNNTFWSHCGQLFGYLDRVAVGNLEYTRLCNEVPKWMYWRDEVGGVDGRMWSPPSDYREAKSHAFALYKMAAMQQFSPLNLYLGLVQFDAMIAQFNNDFIETLREALEDIIAAEPTDVASKAREAIFNFTECGPGPSTNEAFSPSEMADTLKAIEDLWHLIMEKMSIFHGHLDAQDTKLQEINDRIKALQAGVRTMGRKDWWCLLVGTGMSLIFDGILPAANIGRIAGLGGK